MAELGPKLQWAMDVTVWHHPSFGHKVALTSQKQGQAPKQEIQWTWKGLGIPTEIVKEAQAWVSAVLADHLIWRYGVPDELSVRWAGEPEAF